MKLHELKSGDRFVVSDIPEPREIFVKIWHPYLEHCVSLDTGNLHNWTRNTEVECLNNVVGCSLTKYTKNKY